MAEMNEGRPVSGRLAFHHQLIFLPQIFLPSVDAIRQGDKITGIAIHDSTDTLFEAQAKRLAEWNKKLGA